MKNLVIPMLAVCATFGAAAPALAVDKSSPKCLPFVASNAGNGIMFETFTGVSTTAGGTPDGFLLEDAGVGVATTADGNPEGLTADACVSLGIATTAGTPEGYSNEDRRRRAAQRGHRRR